MAKVHPQSLLSSVPSLPEVYTIWMKSLVLNGHGCTVYDRDGRVAYRVDNYDTKCSDEVYLMDHSGNTLFKIVRKKLRLFGRWEGYRCDGSKEEEETPTFRVRNDCRILKRDQSCRATVTVGCDIDNPTYYEIEGRRSKSCYVITDMAGGVVAEIKRKQTATGVALGDDVLMLVVEPNIDHMLIMGIVVVCGLINHNM